MFHGKQPRFQPGKGRGDRSHFYTLLSLLPSEIEGREKKRGGEPRFIAAPSIVVPEGRGVYPRKGVYGGIVIEVVCDDSMRPEFCRPDAKEKGGSINVSDFYCLHLFLLSEVCYFSFWDSFDGSARIAEEEQQPEKQ